MALSAAEVLLVVKAKDEASKTLGGIQGKLGGMRNAAIAGFAAVGAGAVAAGVGLFKLGQSFNDAFDRIAIGTGAAGEDLAALKDNFKNVFGSIPTDMESASTAIADFNTRTGATGPLLEDIAKSGLELTRLLGGDLDANITNVTRAMGDWNIANEQAPQFMDELFVLSQQTGVAIDQLTDQMVKYGAPLRQLGFSHTQAAATLAQFEKEGVNAELVMGSMRIALGKMARDGEPAIETFQRVTEEIKNAGSVSEANAMALELFGARAGPDMAAAIREGRFEIDELMASLEGSEGALMRSAAQTQDFGEAWTLLKNNVLLILEPVATRVFIKISELMTRLSQWVQRNRPQIEAFIESLSRNLSAAVSTLSSALNAAMPTIEFILTNVKAGFEVIRPVLQWLIDKKPAVVAALVAIGIAAILAFTPITLPILAVVAAIVGLLFVIGLLSKNWDAIKKKTLDIWESISDFMNDELEIIVTIVTFHFNIVRNYIETTLNVIRGVIQVVTSLIRGDWDGAWNGIKQIATAIWDGIVNDITLRLGFLRDAMVFAWGFIRAVIEGAWNGLESAASATWDAIRDAIVSPIQAIIDKVKELIDLIEQIPSPGDLVDLIPGSGAVRRLGSWIPGRAAGGALAPGWNVVGERGFELLYNGGAGGQVYSNPDSRRMLANAEPSRIAYVTINAEEGSNASQVAQTVMRMLREELGMETLSGPRLAVGAWSPRRA